MMLLAPWALWMSLVGGAVIALYVLKIKRHQQVVPALDFWRQLAGRTRVHSLFQRLKRLLSLLLWLVIAACLVLALANPIFSLGRIKPRAIAVIIDNSASMQAVEPNGTSRTRFQLAGDAIGDMTTRRPVNDEWLLIEAARDPRVLSPWTYDHKLLRKAVEDLQPFNGSGDLHSAIELAGQLVEGKPDPCIVVISDGADGAVNELAATDSRIIPWPIGETCGNLGITQLAVRLHRQHSNHHVLVGVCNASNEKIDSQLALEIDGVVHSVELLSLDPHGAWEKTIVVDAPEGGLLRASIDRPDALMLDNEAYAVLEPIRPAVVWLVSPESEAFFFEQALAAMSPLVWPEESLTMTPSEYEQAISTLATSVEYDVRSPDLIIFNNAVPTKLPETGRFIMVNAWPKDIPAVMDGSTDSPQLFITPKPHPLTQYLSLHGSRLARAHKVSIDELAAPVTVLAHDTGGDPLIFLCEQRDRQSLCIAFDVMESDLPFRNAFPMLLRNALGYMHSEAPSWLKAQHAIGEPVRLSRPLPAGVTSARLEIWRNQARGQVDLDSAQGEFMIPVTATPAAFRLMFGEEFVATAINLADIHESRIEPSIGNPEAARALSLSERLFGGMPWFGFAMTAAALIALEWLTFHHRWTE